MVSNRRMNAILICLTGVLVLFGCGKTKGPEGKVFFVEPKDGAEITGPVKVVMGVEGMTVKPAGEVVEGTGHHHLLINHGAMPAGEVVPTDDTHRHFGKGQTDTVLNLAPGDYDLTLQFADGLHRSYGDKLSATIHVKVLPAT